MHLPRPNTWPLNIQRLGRFRPYCLPIHFAQQCGPFTTEDWRIGFSRQFERTACDCPAIARGCPHYPFSSSASSPSAIAHARNARAAPRALASPDISSRRRTTRSRLYGNRGPTYVRANSAASSRVRTSTTRAMRMGGSNTKSVMPRKLLVVDRNNQARASHCTIAPHFYTTLNHKYHSYITHLSPISLLYHSYVGYAPTTDRTNCRGAWIVCCGAPVR